MKFRNLLLFIPFYILMSSCQNIQNAEDKSQNGIGTSVADENNPTTFSSKALEQQFISTTSDTLSLKDILKQNNNKTLIKIWASWCPDCVKDLQKLKAVQVNHPELNYVFLSYDKNQDAWKNAIEKHQIKGEHFYILSDWKTGTFRKEIALDWIPRYILTDKNGTILLFKAIEADQQALINIITQNN
ncbi:MAG: thioredoxin family protein [Bacteroidota bacterium]|nr:thioredoxin family protein [Bacteroidota bacterium]